MAKAKKKLTIKVFENRELAMKGEGYPYYVTVTYNRKINRIKSPTWEYLYSIGKIFLTMQNRRFALDRIKKTGDERLLEIIKNDDKSLLEIITKNDIRLINNIRVYHEEFIKDGFFDVAMLKSGDILMETLKNPIIDNLMHIRLSFMEFLEREYEVKDVKNALIFIGSSKDFLTSIKIIKDLNENLYSKLRENFPTYFIIIDYFEELFNKEIIPYNVDLQVNDKIITPIREIIYKFYSLPK